ncbi:DUF72 domain-containing protein [Lysinibacillus fusiformis]|nr:DUF72 domain-containing protein [Lysinibacillus fusiformis]
MVKAYQGMTGHLRDDNPYETRNEMFEAFRQCASAFQNANKLAMILVQFPPWFDCSVKNVNYIRYVKQQLAEFPIAVEFRNRTWYSAERKDETIRFLKEHGFIHTVCDEPQAGVGSVPFVGEASHEKALEYMAETYMDGVIQVLRKIGERSVFYTIIMKKSLQIWQIK